MNAMDALRKNIKELRASRGWEQVDLAAETGFSTGHIARIESPKGTSWVSDEFVSAVAKAFNVSESRLFFDSSARPPISLSEVLDWIRDQAGDAAAARYLAREDLLPKRESKGWQEMSAEMRRARAYHEAGGAEHIRELRAQYPVLKAAEPVRSSFFPSHSREAVLAEINRALTALDDLELQKTAAALEELTGRPIVSFLAQNADQPRDKKK